MAAKIVRTSVALALVTAVGAGAAVGAADRDPAATTGPAASQGAGPGQKPIRFAGSELFIEINATDGEAGLRMNLDGEDWRRLTLRDPNGRTVLDVTGKGRLNGYGLTGMTFESREAPLEEVPFRRFKARFPEGRYTFTGITVEGRRLIGSDRLTHDIPSKPRILAPTEDAVVDAASLVVSWQPVTTPRGIRIVRYRVIVTETVSDRELSMEFGPDATSAAIPGGFLERGAEYRAEVLARDRSGNQTISEVPFKTSK